MATTTAHLDDRGVAHLLKHFTHSHPLRSPSPLPASARTDPRQKQRLPPPTSSSPLLWTLPTWFAFVQFAFAKGLHILLSLLKHVVFGPQRKSWGYRMTLITSFMRNVASYTDFADIVLLRRLISLTYFIPLPADAVVTPITFLVPKRNGADAARGFMREWDLLETGTRELQGEWVVGNDVWKRLKAERRSRWHAEMRRRSAPHGHTHAPSRLREEARDDVSTTSSSSSPLRSVGMAPQLSHDTVRGSDSGSGPGTGARTSGRQTPDPELEGEAAAAGLSSKRERVIYYVHGGAYYVGNAATHRLITIGVSKSCNARVFAITYRLAPEAAFPLPLLDVLHGYQRLLAPPLSIPPENIIIAGDSAGGGLSLALCMYLRDNGYALPAGLVLMSPWVDLTMSCGSWDENADSDVIPRPESDDHLNPVACYLGPKGLARFVTHPYASPLFGDLRGLPPILIQSGDSEVLRDEITLLAHKATLAGVPVTHELYEDMVHVFQTFTWLPAAQAAINSVGRWVRQTLPRIEWEQRQAAALAAEEARTLALEEEASRGVHDETDMEELEIADGAPYHAAAAGFTDADFDRYSYTYGPGSPAPAPSATLASVDGPPVRRRSRASSRVALGPGAVATSASALDVPGLPLTVSPATLSPSLAPQPSPGLSPRPRLRRAATSGPLAGHRSPFASTTSLASASPSTSSGSTHLPLASPAALRRRRQTASLNMATSPPHTPREPHTPPTPRTVLPSPTPSVRRRLRAPSYSPYPTTPSTRNRSASHTDIFHLVEGYYDGGAANNTVVYAPGGEIRSVGVLGDEASEDE